MYFYSYVIFSFFQEKTSKRDNGERRDNKDQFRNFSQK